MKRIVCMFVIALFLAAASWASIALDSSNVQTYQVGGLTMENNDVASAIDFEVNFQAETLRFTLGFGQIKSGVFVAGRNAKALHVTIDATTGAVAFSDGRSNRQLSPTQLTAIKNVMKNWRNSLENFALQQAATVGTQVPW